MHKYNAQRRPLRFLFILLLGTIVITSCTSRKKLTYLQDLEQTTIEENTQTGNAQRSTEYYFKPKDEVYIKINSLDPATYAFFGNGSGENQNLNNSNIGLYLNSYTVNDSGYIDLPNVGAIPIGNLSSTQAQDTIANYLKKYLKDVSVTVKLSGFRVTLLGEVKNPGLYTNYVSNLNILEALAIAGDATTYANREKVMIIREVKGKEQIYTLNLLDKNLIDSEFFHLLPNDVIYIEPLGTKTWGFDRFPYSILLSTISTIVTIYALLR